MAYPLAANTGKKAALLEPDETLLEKARALRPIYFAVVVWGERFTHFLLQFCIPALLAPNNIPALRNRGNRFLIATTEEDWKRIDAHPIVSVLRKHVETVFIRIPFPPHGVPVHLHMGIGHKLATQMAFDRRAYGIVLTPDLILSDGTIAAAQRHAAGGAQLVVTPALRFGEEPLFECLSQLRIASVDSRLGDEAKALVVTGRQLVWAGIRSFHSETLTYEWDAPYFSAFPSACWWRVPGEDGVIVHSLSWFPLIVDYEAVAQHDSSVMDRWTIDGDYIHRNFGLDSGIHVVQDSDEAMLVSWAPLACRAYALAPDPQFELPLVGAWLKGLRFYEALCDPRFDPLKRSLFARAVYWHGGEINAASWRAVETRAAHALRKYVGTMIGDSACEVPRNANPGRALPTMTLRMARRIRALSLVLSLCRHYWNDRRRVFGIAKQAFRGDAAARKRVRRSIRNIAAVLRGRLSAND